MARSFDEDGNEWSTAFPSGPAVISREDAIRMLDDPKGTEQAAKNRLRELWARDPRNPLNIKS